MGNSYNKFAEWHDDYLVLCAYANVPALRIHDDFEAHQEALLKQYGWDDINSFLSFLATVNQQSLMTN